MNDLRPTDPAKLSRRRVKITYPERQRERWTSGLILLIGAGFLFALAMLIRWGLER